MQESCKSFSKRRRPFLHLLALLVIFLLFLHQEKVFGMEKTSGEAFTVSGQVNDDDGPLAGVSIREKGTSNGTSTDQSGQYSLTVENENAVLIFSFVGYNTEEVSVEGRSEITIHMQLASEQLGDIVVTALGIKREKKSLGYSVGRVAGKDVAEVPHENVLTGLSGRVPGVSISQTSDAGSSVNMVIRGASSLSGNNQPLFVIDGTPVNNSLNNVGGFGNDNPVDYGNAISDINPEDIESIDILKGPSAAALYGSRAGNGVVIITTKSGSQRKGLGISLTTSTVFDLPHKYFPGNNSRFASGSRPYTPDNHPGQYLEVNAASDGWNGPELDKGYEAVQWNSPLDENGNPIPIPLVSHPNNQKNFMRTGITNTNNIAVSNADERMNYRLSFTNMNHRGMIPNTDLFKNAINLHTAYSITSTLEVEANLNFVNNKSNNRASRSRGSNPMRALGYMDPSIDIMDLKNYWLEGQEDIQQLSYAPGAEDNPWFLAYEAVNPFHRNRGYGNIKGTWHISDRFSIMGRYSMDTYEENRETKIAKSYSQNPNGVYGMHRFKRSESNTEVMGNYTNNFGDFDLDLGVGYNYMYQDGDDVINSTNDGGIVVPGLFTLSNILPTSLDYSSSTFEKAIYSVYGTASLGYKGWAYLNLTARNDWSSTLPVDNRSYFYPSASLSLLLHEALHMSSDISMFKLRGGWAQVGKDTDPYNLLPVATNTGAWAGQTRLSLPAGILNAELKPEISTSFEVGLDLGFLNEKYRLEGTYYQSDNKNQILGINTPSSAGYTSRLINAGLVRSRGFELAAGFTPTSSSSATQVDLNFNISRNRTKIVRLTDDLDHFELWDDSKGKAVTFIGENIGQMYGREMTTVTDESSPYFGYPLLDDNGEWQENGSGLKDLVKIGNFNANFTLGFQTAVSYKGFTLSASLDWRSGGDFVSKTYRYKESDLHGDRWLDEVMLNPNGIDDLPQFLKDNADKYVKGIHSVGGPTEELGGYDYTSGGITLKEGAFNPGVIAEKDQDGKIIGYKENLGGPGTKILQYSDNYPWDFIQAALFPADFIKLREVSLTYAFPSQMAHSLGLQHLGLSIYTRDVILWTKAKIGIDPERAFQRSGNGFYQGLEWYNNLPWTIPLGVKLSVDF